MNMHMDPTTQTATRRHIVYVDDRLQKWLLIALVTFEVLLIAGALWMLYLQLDSLLEANLYRVHYSGDPHIYPLLLKNALIGIGGLIGINLVLLLIADRMWSRHVNSILQPLNELLAKVEALDFSDEVSTAASHKVVELARSWRNSERQRLRKLRAQIAELDLPGGPPSPEAQARARAALENILKLLP